MNAMTDGSDKEGAEEVFADWCRTQAEAEKQTAMANDSWCFTCEKPVSKCWGNGLCSGGGHCQECMGYDFPSYRAEAES